MKKGYMGNVVVGTMIYTVICSIINVVFMAIVHFYMKDSMFFDTWGAQSTSTVIFLSTGLLGGMASGVFWGLLEFYNIEMKMALHPKEEKRIIFSREKRIVKMDSSTENAFQEEYEVKKETEQLQNIYAALE